MNKKMKRAAIASISCFALVCTATTASATLDSSLGNPTTIKSTSAAKGFLDRYTPTGLYFEFEGKKFFFGEYSDHGESLIKYPGSLWEVRIGGNVSAHGYGETPVWVRNLAKKYFGW